ncbi:hypothetical protein FSARC_14580 [Fusarium sarcochroum]|uniref:Zn(2)-C6 fungal-type domain-containing protein n=1 Tax=Fusarium sarcochroum TaxID=1208366 RepID=A0A8H4SS76_9HYPO|nr:hypothetical protein FSARC_14580 [Fusarium sarcochroum]
MQDNENAAVEKSSQPCQACRSRHRRCDWDEDECLQCRNTGIKCERQSSLKFRYHPKQKALSRASSNLWRPCPLPRGPAEFYDETPELRDMYTIEPLLLPELTRARHLPLSGEFSSQRTSAESATADGVTNSDTMNPFQEDTMSVEYPADDTSPLTKSLTEEVASLTEDLVNDTLPLSPVEALLIRNFTNRMAQWTDIADPFRTFETVVSRLSFTDPIIRYAICAFSARHFHRCHGNEDGDSQALDYQNRCLNLLIPSMCGDHRITENVLTAVALLRQNEEMDG